MAGFCSDGHVTSFVTLTTIKQMHVQEHCLTQKPIEQSYNSYNKELLQKQVIRRLILTNFGSYIQSRYPFSSNNLGIRSSTNEKQVPKHWQWLVLRNGSADLLHHRVIDST